MDVEAIGTSPYRGLMTEFGAVLMNNESFHGKIYNTHLDPDNNAVPIIDSPHSPLTRVLAKFDTWLRQNIKGRPIFVSDNPAYDWQWISAAFDSCLMDNPFGHSARRIGDFYAGLEGDFYSTQGWKSLRKTPHTHNPVDDARGNMEALTELIRQTKEPLRR